MNTINRNIHPARSWFALYTAPRAEKKVGERLSESGIAHFLPTLKVMRKWSDRVKVVEIPLFNSYIFVNCTPFELLSLTKVYGVARIVYYNGKPAVVREEEIEQIRSFIRQADNCELITGDMVEVVCGLLKGEEKLISGEILKVKRNYLVIFIEQLGVKACVKKCEVKKLQLKRYE